MEYRNLGRAGVKVSVLSLGAMNFGNPTSEEESIRIIERAIDAGINLIDTANVYPMGPFRGISEEIVGKAVKGKRDQVLIATKVHGRMGPGPNDYGQSRAHIMREVENSLRRLQTDYIDLYQVHAPDPTTPLEETLETLTDLVRQGKVRYIGCSNFPAWLLCKSLWISDKRNLAKFVSNQVAYNLLYRKIEEEVVPLCLDQGVGILVYSPLAAGVLTGKYKWGEKFPEGTRLAGVTGDTFGRGYFTEENMRIVEEFCKIAREMGYTPVQLAVAWAMAQPGVSSVILGPKTVEQLEGNLKALEVKLSDEDLKRLNALTDHTVRKTLWMG